MPLNPKLPNAIQWRTHVAQSDIEAVHRLVAATGVFNEEEIDVAAELAAEHYEKGSDSGYDFLFAESAETLLGYTCYGRIPFTQGRFDLYWIAVHPAAQGNGLAAQLIARTETLIRSSGGIIVYAETSSRIPYHAARQFYLASGYHQEALLPRFYSDADDKLIYAKRLVSST